MAEKYSRGKFEQFEAEQNKEVANDATRKNLDATLGDDGYSHSINSMTENELARLDAKMKRMIDAGHGEALELNKEYGKLRKAFDEAAQNLYNFEHDKLGQEAEGIN